MELEREMSCREGLAQLSHRPLHRVRLGQRAGSEHLLLSRLGQRIGGIELERDGRLVLRAARRKGEFEQARAGDSQGGGPGLLQELPPGLAGAGGAGVLAGHARIQGLFPAAGEEKKQQDLEGSAFHLCRSFLLARFGGETTMQNPARRKEDFDKTSRL